MKLQTTLNKQYGHTGFIVSLTTTLRKPRWVYLFVSKLNSGQAYATRSRTGGSTHSDTISIQKSVKQTNEIERTERLLLKFLQIILHSFQFCIHLPDI